MRNYKISMGIFISIISLCFILNSKTKQIVNLLEAQTNVIYSMHEINQHSDISLEMLKKDYTHYKKILVFNIDKEMLRQIDLNIRLLENSIKNKDITSCREICIEIMSLLDNIESNYMTFS